MKKLALCFGLLVLFGTGQGCKSHLSKTETKYVNKNTYEVKVGDTFKIYYSLNSCCRYCIINRDNLQNIELVDEIKVEPNKEVCSGCDQTFAFIFTAKTIGIDTIWCKTTTASQSCPDSYEGADKFIVRIK